MMTPTLPHSLAAALAAIGAGSLYRPDTLARVPAAPGAYVLALALDRPQPLPQRFGAVLAPGWYLYCGSACGPGGLRARLRRHMRRDKPVRWHVDHLSGAATGLTAAVAGDRGECDLVDALAAAGGRFPVTGFGSTDCRRCPGHLLAWPD